MKRELFDTSIEIKDKVCSFNSGPAKSVSPYINMYVRVTNYCDAQCPFCSFSCKDDHSTFNPYFMLYILQELEYRKIKVNKVSFTGGEPTSCKKELETALQLIRKYYKDIFIVINTNGNIIENLPSPDLVDSLALSRHYLPTYDTFNIKNSVDHLKSIVKIFGKDKMHISCVLQKGLIDEISALVKFMDAYSELGFEDFGFVSMMKVNDYASDRFIDFKDLGIDTHASFRKTQSWSKPDCRCNNYLYMSKNGNLNTVYARYFQGGVCEAQPLVLDIDTLRYGFGGKIIKEM